MSGEDFELKALRKMQSFEFCCSTKFEKAGNLFEKAATEFKSSGSWGDAARVYNSLAECHIQLKDVNKAAFAYYSAATLYKDISTEEAVSCFNHAVEHFLQIGRNLQAAKCCKELGELYEDRQDFNNALISFEKASDILRTEGDTSFANECNLKVAYCAPRTRQYSKAVDMYEKCARQLLKNADGYLNFHVRSYLLNAGLCQCCEFNFADSSSMNNTLEKYKEMDQTFGKSKEYLFLADLADAMHKSDSEKFVDVVKEFESSIGLDARKSQLLSTVKDVLHKQILTTML